MKQNAQPAPSPSRRAPPLAWHLAGLCLILLLPVLAFAAVLIWTQALQRAPGPPRALADAGLSADAIVILLAVAAVTLALLRVHRLNAAVRALATAATRIQYGEAVTPPVSAVRELDAIGTALTAVARQWMAGERRLRDSEGRYQALFEAAPMAMLLADPETLGLVAFNQRAAIGLGYSHTALAALRVPDIAASPDATDLAAALDGAGPPQVFETRFRTHDGALRDVLVHCGPLRHQGRTLVCLAWQDLTEQRQQQRVLQRMAARQASILDVLPANVALLDDAGRIVAVNQAWSRFAQDNGMAHAGTFAVGADYLAACAPAAAAGDPAAQAARQGLRAILDGRRARLDLIYPCKAPDGPDRWFQMIAVPDTEPGEAADPHPGGAVVMHLDITERIQAERTLLESEARLRLFIERAPAAIAVFDTEMRYLAVSRRMLRDFGFDAEDPTSWHGRSHYELFLDLPDRWREVHRRVLRLGETHAVEEDQWVHADNRIDWVRWEMTPWRRQDGSIGGGVLFVEVITARKEAEASLRTSEARLRLAIEAAELGTWDEQLASGEAILNERAFHILGLPPADSPVTVAIWRDRVHPDDADRVDSAFAEALGGDAPFQAEHRIVRPDGSVRWIRPMGRFIRGPDGVPTRSVGVFNDITTLKQAAEDQQRLLQLIEHSDDFIATVSPSFELTYLNRGGRRMIGLDETADVTHLRVADYLTPGSLPHYRSVVVPAMRDAGAWNGEMQFRHMRTGAAIDVQRAIFTLRSPIGAVIGYATVTRNVTEQKRYQTALQHSEARLRAILETVPDAMVLVDEAGIIQSVSATAEALFGWPADEVLGQHIAALLPTPDGRRTGNVLACRAAGAIVVGDGTLIGQRKDGSRFALELSVGTLRADGQPRYVGFMRDLTERHRTQARLQVLQAELLQISRLGAAGAMASVLAHELNQPLTAAASAARAASRTLANLDVLDAEQSARLKESLALAVEQALRAGQIVHRLRDFIARGGEADMRLEALPALIEDASTLALLGAREAGIQVVFRLPANLPMVLADRVQIQQVLINLMRNAVQAMAEQAETGPAPFPRRELSVSAQAIEPDMVEISVADTGPGLAPEIAERLFEPFVTSRPNGMGLGLSICRSLVEAHGGQLRAAANPGGGSVFAFTLLTAPESPAGEDAIDARHRG
jgi:two-component system sensor kinase FixL